MFNINDMTVKVHRNAVEHGFWDTERPKAETYALIHSEWSEALEEDRAGRPMVWYSCSDTELVDDAVCPYADEKQRCSWAAGFAGDCAYRGHKPEGIAIELLDGVIRILDYAGRNRMVLEVCEEACDKMGGVAELVFTLHGMISDAGRERDKEIERCILSCCVSRVFGWIRGNGFDPEKLLVDKHNYNVSRPRLHGKKY